MTYWITFADGSSGCVALYPDKPPESGDGALKKWIESKLPDCTVTNIRRLPYAATPLLIGNDLTLCYSPEFCAGRTSCPKMRSCSG